ncbi:sugar-binding protein [Planctomycetota bacterium]
MERLKHITMIFLLAVVLPASAASAKQASVLLQEGLYAEEVDGDLDAAITIYEKVIQDGSAQRSHVAQALYRQGMCYLKKQQEQQAKLAFEKLIAEYNDQTKVVNKAKPLLQELGNADPAALMPADTLVYLEFGSPGKQVETILNMLKDTPLENPLAALGGQSQGGPSPGNIVAGFLNPNMMAEFKKVRGAGIGITGVAEENPPVVVVLFPGKSDALRGLIAGGLALVAKPVEAIEGMQTVEFTDGGGAAYDDTVVILASPPAYEAGQLTWCVRQYKGLGKEPTLASSNRSFTQISKKDRQENALTLWANVDQLYTALTKEFPEGQIPQEILQANSLVDFGNVDDVLTCLTFKEDGIALESNVGFKDGYSGMAYHLFRTPKLSKAALEAIPSDAIGLFSVALNGADSPQSQAIREQIRNTAGINLGDDIFANIEQITLFAVPSAGALPESLAGAPPFVGSIGLALRSPIPQQTRRILTGALSAANLIKSQSANEEPEQQIGRYKMELVNNQTIHCYTDQRSKTTILSLNPNVVEVSVLGRARSVTAAGPLKNALNELSPGVNKLALFNVGRAIETGGVLFLAGMNESSDDIAELFAQVAKSCEKTTVQVRTHEDSDSFNIRAEIRDLPPADTFFGPMMQLSQMISGARQKAWAEKKEAGIPASIRKVSRPVVIDGRAEGLWSEARQYKIGNVIYMPASSDTDLSANYKAMWDEKNLYVLVNVTDDSLKNDSESDLWYQDDCVEVFIDADNSKSNEYGENDGQYHFDWDRTNPAMDRFQNGRTDGVEFAMVTTEKGYRTEIKFPWSTLGTSLSAGMKIGLDVHVNDDDDGGDRDTKMTWRGKEDNAWQTPQAFGTAELTGLIGWWKLDESGGRDVADASGYGNVGKILNGEPRWQTSGGKIGGALRFGGNGDWVHVANQSKFDCIAEVTVAAWIKVNRFDKEWQAIVTKGDSAWRLQRNQNQDNLEFACSGLKIPSGSPYGNLLGQKNVNDGKWHHVAGVYDGQNMYLYVDGRVDVSQPASGPIGTNNHPVYIGENAEMTGRFWNGLIDDVRVYNGALGQAEIRALYNEGK